MSKTFHRPATGDTRTVPDVLAANYEANPAWEPGPMPGTTAGEVAVLKGAELDAALEAAGLPKTGTVAEKRQRLADHSDQD